MAEVVWSVLCAKGVLDKFTGTVSLHDVLEGIEIETLPPTPKKNEKPILLEIKCCLVTLWIRTKRDQPESLVCRLVLRYPNGKRFVQPEATIDLKAGMTARFFATLEGIPFVGLGRYTFLIEEKRVSKPSKIHWVKTSQVPFDVNMSAQPQEAKEKER